VPEANGALDPTLGGAGLIVFAVGDSFAEAESFDLPAASWQRTGSGASSGYRYRDANGSIKTVVLRNGRLTIRGDGASLYSLADAPQGEMGMALSLGSGLGFCASAPARAPASKYDSPTVFTGVKGETVPATCPDVPRPPVGSASEAFLSLPIDLID
jgi:hypothetical protein